MKKERPDLVGEDDDLRVPELSDELLEEPEEPTMEEPHDHILEQLPELELDEDMVPKPEKSRLPIKSMLRVIPGLKKVKSTASATASGVGQIVKKPEPPPNPATGDTMGQAASQSSQIRQAALGPIVPSDNSPVAPGLAPDDRIVGESQSFEEYNTFQKSEATASDLESLVMLERAIAKGERRGAGESKIQMYITAAAVLMIVVVITIYMAMELGILDFMK